MGEFDRSTVSEPGRPPFEFIEGATSDIAFEARGETLPALFTAAAEARFSAVIGTI